MPFLLTNQQHQSTEGNKTSNKVVKKEKLSDLTTKQKMLINNAP